MGMIILTPGNTHEAMDVYVGVRTNVFVQKGTDPAMRLNGRGHVLVREREVV